MVAQPEPRFLYVEDDMLSRRVVDVLVRQVMGYASPTLFKDSTHFMERVRALPEIPDVVFLDIQVRPHDGYEMLRMLRSDSRYQDAAVIAMTANVMAHDVELLKQAGFNGLIGKPIIREVFPDLVHKILEGEPVWYVP